MKKIKYLLILLLLVATPVFAASDKLIMGEDTVLVDEDKSGSVFIAGNEVDAKGTVDGLSFVAGNEVNISSTSDYLFAAGNDVKLEGAKFRDGFLAGSTVELNGCNVERDLYVAGAIVRLSSDIGRNVHVAGGTVVITGTINGNIDIYASSIEIKDGAVINGLLRYSEDSEIKISDKAFINSSEKIKQVEISFFSSFKSVVLNTLLSFVNALVVGLVLILLMPKLFEKIISISKEKMLSTFGIGLLLLLFMPIAAIIILISMVGMSLSLLLLTFYVVAIYISTIFSSYYLGNLILGKKIKNKYLILLISLFAYYVIRLIPFIGTLLVLFLVPLGLGLICRILFKRK